MKNWNKQEDEILKAGYELERPIADIAEDLGRTTGAVRGRAAALGISRAKIEEMKKIDFEDDTCPYCGQVRITEGDCNCDGARRARRIQERIQNAGETIEELFGEECKKDGYTPIPEDNIETLNAAVVQIVNYKLHAASFVLSSGTRAKITRSKGGSIKIERTETKKNSAEVDE